MADIELIIKLNEDDYINIKNAINSLIENGVERASMSKLCLAVLDGTPLPKNHGRLKDVDWIDDNCEDHYSDKDGSRCYTWRDIDNADTIIEVDKAERSDKE